MRSDLSPNASVIIPSSGRPQRLEATLEALSNQDLGAGSFEVIVADDGSQPPLQARLTPYENRLHVRSVRLEACGPSAARNAAARLARAPLLLFLDDDCVPGPSWIKSYFSVHAAVPEAALVGPLGNGTGGSPGSEAYHLILAYLYARHLPKHPAATRRTQVPFMLSANFGVLAASFRSLGGFDENFRIAAEDRDFSERWVSSGRRLRAVPEAIVLHHRPLSILGFLSQHFRFGRGRTMLQKALQRRNASGRLRESAAFYLQLVTFPLRTPCESNRGALMLLILLSQVWLAAGTLYELAGISIRNLSRHARP